MPEISTAIQQPQITAPSTPATGFVKLYPKADGQYYKLNSTGVETILGGLPAGGTANQVLAKVDATNYNVQWVTPSGGGITIPLGQNLTFAPDNTYTIGQNLASRPSVVYVSGFLKTGIDATQEMIFGGSGGAAYIRPSASNVIEFGTAGSPRWKIDASGHFMAGLDNTYDIGASASGRLRYLYAGSGVITPVVSTPLVQSSSALQLGANGAAKWRIHTTGDLWAETDNAQDIGASSGSRPRKIWTNTLEVADAGADTPATKFNGMTAFGGRINIGGVGGADRIGWMVTGINTPNTTIMNGSTQTLWYAEYWSNDANTGVLNGMDFGCIGPPTVKVSEINLMRLRGVGARTQKPDYARGLKVESIDNGLVANFGIDIAAPGTSAGLNYGLNVNGKTWLHGVVEIGTDGTLANRPYIRTPAAASQSLSLESPKQYVFLSGYGGAHVSGNAYWDGTNWQRYDVASAAAVVIATAGSVLMQTALAGANPISVWAQVLALDSTGLTVAWQKGYKHTYSTAAVQWAMTSTGDDYNALYCGPSGILFTNYASTVRIGSLDNSGNLNLNGQIQGGSLSVLGGSTLSGRASFYAASSTGIATASASLGSIEIQPGSGGGASMLCFHRPGAFATYFGVDTDNIFRVGGWSMGAVAYRLILGDGYANPALGVNGANVGSNGVLFSCHANIYAGIYYSTTSQFLGWPSEGRFKAQQAALPDPLALLDRAAISYRQPSVKWHEGEALVRQDENGALSWGFRAEDWRDIPELVQSGPAGIDSFNLTGMIPLTWEAVRAVYTEVKALRTEIQILKENYR